MTTCVSPCKKIIEGKNPETVFEGTRRVHLFRMNQHNSHLQFAGIHFCFILLLVPTEISY